MGSAACPVCNVQFHDGWCYDAGYKLYQHMSHGRAHRHARRKLYGPFEETRSCPVCNAQFRDGGFHDASSKLYQHMAHGKAHRRMRQEMPWS